MRQREREREEQVPRHRLVDSHWVSSVLVSCADGYFIFFTMCRILVDRFPTSKFWLVQWGRGFCSGHSQVTWFAS